MNRKSLRFVYPLLAVLTAGVYYGWRLWYYGGLFRGNQPFISYGNDNGQSEANALSAYC